MGDFAVLWRISQKIPETAYLIQLFGLCRLLDGVYVFLVY